MKFLAVCLLLFTYLPSSSALFMEDVGKLDFLISTAGHGPNKFVQAAAGDGASSVLTSDSAGSVRDDDSPTSCYVASRSIQDGSLQWRRNVCSSSSKAQRHVLAVGSKSVATLDDSGSVRAWSLDSGALLWNVLVPASRGGSLSISTVSKDSREYVVVSVGAGATVLDGTTGESLNSVKASDLKADPVRASSTEVFCPESLTLVALQVETGTVVAWRSKGQGDKQSRLAESEKVVSSLEDDSVTAVSLLVCSADKVSVLVSSARGTTTQVTFSSFSNDAQAQAKTMWKTEEGLAQVSSAIMLDASHYVGDLKDMEEGQLLQLSNRLQMQWQGLVSFFSAFEATVDRRDHTFGFVKVAVLLSSSANRIFGLGTSGNDRGVIRYVVDLPRDSEWHRLVHGTSTGQSGAHGLNGASHNREVMVLSSSKKNGQQLVQWNCFDGSSGNVHSKGSVTLSSSTVVQVVPLAGVTGACRQGALLVTKDGSLHAVPAETSFDKQIQSTPNGLYTHVVDKEKGKVTSLRIIATDSGLKSAVMGTAVFAGEEILSAAYPMREEVVQSPCSVLGDDSLLLKYLNPHLAAFITMATPSVNGNEFTKALQSTKTPSGKRKPAGVSPDAVTEGSTSDSPPNLFVNIVDTASGRILYRASHSRAGLYPPPKAIISENWVYYTYVNERTRRAEVGVLSLYEGMIDNKGVTAFTSPEQTTSFSSFDARDVKPVVLAKTFSLAKPATAMSMTVSRGGISGQKLLLATIDGQITAVDRKVVDPRRPLGNVKDSEKKEGLQKYSELIPIISFMALSYNQTVESVTSIIAAPTYLESQSLVLAFGGPDIFFTRTSPSRGFDLLPDSFNRLLLSVVVATLLVVLVVTQGMVTKKVVKQGWV